MAQSDKPRLQNSDQRQGLHAKGAAASRFPRRMAAISPRWAAPGCCWPMGLAACGMMTGRFHSGHVARPRTTLCFGFPWCTAASTGSRNRDGEGAIQAARGRMPCDPPSNRRASLRLLACTNIAVGTVGSLYHLPGDLGEPSSVRSLCAYPETVTKRSSWFLLATTDCWARRKLGRRSGQT